MVDVIMTSKDRFLINITSSAGSGKTTLMQKTAEKLKDKTVVRIDGPERRMIYLMKMMEYITLFC